MAGYPDHTFYAELIEATSMGRLDNGSHRVRVKELYQKEGPAKMIFVRDACCLNLKT